MDVAARKMRNLEGSAAKRLKTLKDLLTPPSTDEQDDRALLCYRGLVGLLGGSEERVTERLSEEERFMLNSMRTRQHQQRNS